MLFRSALARGESPTPERNAGGIGARVAKYEAVDLALGRRPYIDDMMVPGLVHGALRLTEHARAEIVGIDPSRAEALPGVERVFTAADVPGELRVGIIHKDWPVMIPVGGRTSYLGDVLAVVVAEDRELARRAAALVDVEYRVLAPITDPVAALAEGSEDAVWGLEGNQLSYSHYERGDVDAALAESAHVVRESFGTQRIEQAFLEP